MDSVSVTDILHVLNKKKPIEMIKFDFSKINLLDFFSQPDEKIKYMIDNGINLEHENVNCTRLIHRAFHLEKVEILKHLVSKKLVYLEAADSYGMRPLHFACKYNMPELVELLLNKDLKLDIDCITNKGKTPIYYAVKRCNFKMVKMLVDAGAYLSIYNGDTLLHIACTKSPRSYSKTDIIELLIQKGLHVDEVNAHEEKPINLAHQSGNLVFMLCLIRNKASININTLTFLVEKGVNLNTLVDEVDGMQDVDLNTLANEVDGMQDVD